MKYIVLIVSLFSAKANGFVEKRRINFSNEKFSIDDVNRIIKNSFPDKVQKGLIQKAFLEFSESGFVDFEKSIDLQTENVWLRTEPEFFEIPKINQPSPPQEKFNPWQAMRNESDAALERGRRGRLAAENRVW